MTLRSRPGLVSVRSRPEMDVATWLDWRQEVWCRDQGFWVATRTSYGGNRGWSRLGFLVSRPGNPTVGRNVVAT